MKNLGYLLKIEFARFYGINKALHSKGKEEKRKFGNSISGLIISAILILFLTSFYGFISYVALKTMGQETAYSVSIMFLACSVFVLFTTIHNTNGVVFGFKDYEVLNSMPIKQIEIILSKLIYVYVESLALSVAFILPVTCVYGFFETPSVLYYIRSVIGILLSPVIPISLGLIIGTLIAIVSAKFKKSNIFSIFLSVAFMCAYVLFCFSAGQVDDSVYANVVLKIKEVYPIIELYVKGITLGKPLWFCVYCFGSILLISSFAFVVSVFFNKINTAITTKRARGNYKVDKVKTNNNVIVTLLKKELKRLFSSTNYFMNCCSGTVMAVFISVILIIKSGDFFSTFEAEEDFNEVLKVIQVCLPIVPMWFVGLCDITSVSISLEGKNVWIIKSLPIKTEDIFKSKVFMHVAISMIGALISIICIGIPFKMPLYDVLLSIIMITSYDVMFALLGLIININNHNYDWQSEIEVIKRSASASISVVIGMLGIIPIGALGVGLFLLGSLFGISQQYLIWPLFTLIFVGVSVLMWNWIKDKGVKKFIKD